MTITLERVPSSGPARDELAALLPDYLRGLGADPDYPYLPLYWTEAGRFPYLIREQGRTAGFALVRQLPDSRAFEMAEFCVLPEFRGRGLGARAARALFAAHPGPWRIGVMADNAGALSFWRRVAPQAAVQPPREADGADGFWMLSLPGAPSIRASGQTAPPQDTQEVRVATPTDTPAMLAVDALALADPARARQITLAAAAGVTVSLTGVTLWPPLMATTRLLGDISLGLMIFSLGVRLASTRVGSMLGIGIAGAIVTPVTGMLMVWVYGAQAGLAKHDMDILFLFGALPPAVSCFIFADRYRREPEKVAAIVMIGNASALFFIPFALALRL